MPPVPHPAWMEIDLDRFRQNLAAIRRRIGPALLCLPVKANAYGHGLVPMSLAAERFGVDRLAVSCLQEGVTLRQAGVRCPILVLGAIHEDQIGDFLGHRLEFSLSSRFKAQLVATVCRQKKLQAHVHLEVDTGMNRTGMRPETALALYEELRIDDSFHIGGLYSHFATADQPNDPFVQKQLSSFQALRNAIAAPHLLWHIANSGGVYFYPASHMDMVRPGLLAFGLTPHGEQDPEIASCLSLRANISYFKVVGAGEGISYGRRHITSAPTRIVTVPVGYGDGYRAALGNRASVLIRGRRFPVVGSVCMDQFMVDIGSAEAFVGEEVVLIGRDQSEEIPLAELASLAHTIPYEILCHLNERIPRYYKEASCSS